MLCNGIFFRAVNLSRHGEGMVGTGSVEHEIGLAGEVIGALRRYEHTGI